MKRAFVYIFPPVSKDWSFILYFRNGELINAETGSLRGEEAARKIINWENSIIEVDDICRKNKREIDKPLMHILMESARIKDENNVIEETYV